jgi:hypothetical protein
VARQITEAFPWDEAPHYLIRDRDRIYGSVVTRRLRAMGICPFSATPKHFCLPAATAALPSASVSGAAAAIDASAVVTAPASTNALTVDLADI